MRRRIVIAAALALALASCGTRSEPKRNRLHVFAAVSVRDPLLELTEAYTAQTGIVVDVSSGGSGQLATQLVYGRIGDVFLSADEREMDRVDRAGLVVPGSRRTLLSNQLVVVVPKGAHTPAAADDLDQPWLERLAIGDPDVVPAGRYARAWLERRGLWDGLAPRVIPTTHVRAALAAVESGAANAAILYRTDAATSAKVVVAFTVGTAEAPPIRYVVAALGDVATSEEALEFIAFLSGYDAAVRFRRAGFIVP